MYNFIIFNFHRSSITFSPELWYTKLTCHVAMHYCVGVNFVTKYQQELIIEVRESIQHSIGMCKMSA